MSFPPDNPPRAATPSSSFSTQPSPPRRGFRLRTLIYLLLLVLVGPCLIAQVPQEIGRWHLAAAFEARDAAKDDVAKLQLEAALKHFPKNPALMLQRSIWQWADGEEQQAIAGCNAIDEKINDSPMLLIARAQLLQRLNKLPEALADCERAASVTSKNPAVLMVRAEILQSLGRHKEAVADWKEVDRVSQMRGWPPRSTALNGLAYARALGQMELVEGLENVNHALDLAPGIPDIRDTRGYLLYLLKQYDAALEDMDPAVSEIEERLNEQKKNSGDLRESLRYEAPDLSELRSPSRVVAVVRYHRALVLLALGREKDAESDLTRVRQLIGKEPDETLF
jgi:tetratricopeptide (TPR) repeat protein